MPERRPGRGPTNWQDKLNGPQRNAYAALEQMFRQYGLESLAPKILDFVKKGYEENTITLLLQDTDEWRKRFVGNEARRAAGLSVLNPGEYIQLEESYKSTLRAYSMPRGFYDKPEDFANLMSADVSPEEVRSRAQAAWSFTQTTSEASRRALRDYYGVDDSHIAAYFLDPQKGQSMIERQAAAASYGGIAARQNMSVDRNRAESWVDRGISAGQVEQGVENAASVYGDVSRIGRRFGENYQQGEALDEFVGGLASARRKRESLSRRESAIFGGTTGTASFGGRDTGSF